ncbi:MAG: type II toxin-antitoxin system VapC family toxin [bacterium]
MELDKNIRYCLDTNILVYAVNQESGFYGLANGVIDLVNDSAFSIFITDKTLYEYYAVVKNILPEKALLSFNELLEIFDGKILRSTENTIKLVQNLLLESKTNSKGKYIHDLVLAAICIDNRIDCLITQNAKDFENIPMLKIQTLE